MLELVLQCRLSPKVYDLLAQCCRHGQRHFRDIYSTATHRETPQFEFRYSDKDATTWLGGCDFLQFAFHKTETNGVAA